MNYDVNSQSNKSHKFYQCTKAEDFCEQRVTCQKSNIYYNAAKMIPNCMFLKLRCSNHSENTTEYGYDQRTVRLTKAIILGKQTPKNLL